MKVRSQFTYGQPCNTFTTIQSATYEVWHKCKSELYEPDMNSPEKYSFQIMALFSFFFFWDFQYSVIFSLLPHVQSTSFIAGVQNACLEVVAENFACGGMWIPCCFYLHTDNIGVCLPFI